MVTAGVKVVPAESYISGVKFKVTHVFTVIGRGLKVIGEFKDVWIGPEFKVIS